MNSSTNVDNGKITGILGYTWWQVSAALGIWLAIYSVIGIIIQNPFYAEPNAGADIIYYNIMYLHGFLIGFAGLACLTAAELLGLTSRKTRIFILWLTVIATIVGCIGGIFDTTEKQTVFWLWVQIVSFFLFDGIVFAFTHAIWRDRKRAKELNLSMPFWTAFAAAVSLDFAAVMGHIAGWILTFGDWPFHIFSFWGKIMGEDVPTLMANLTGSHSHEIIVAFLSLIVAVAAWRFGYNQLVGIGKTIAEISMWFVAIGTVIMTVMYVVGGFTNIEPPTLFAFGPGGINGLASDDLITGVGVMLGGLVVLLSLMFSKRFVPSAQPWGQKMLSYLTWLWGMMVFIVVVIGFSIEFNEKYFGAGDPTALGAKPDAMFNILHQDLAFFLLPAIMVMMLITTNLFDWKKKEVPTPGKLSLIFGIIITFMGAIVYTFITPTAIISKKIGVVPIASFSSGYIILAVGMFITLVSILWLMKDIWIQGKNESNIE